MMHNQGQAASAVSLLAPVSAANTAAATSAWIDVTRYEGDLVFTLHAGVITGTLDWTLEDATDNSGTGGAGISPNEAFVQVTTSNDDPNIQKVTLKANKTRGFVRCVGTIVTGPAVVAASFMAHPGHVGQA
jgi:hypothetical protein